MSLNHARLTTPAHPHVFLRNLPYKKFYKHTISPNFEDGHSRLETPVLFPNTEVKLPTLLALVSDKMRTQ